jgi:hypothetical protein
MKKLKTMICGLLLSTCLAGNVFAGDFTSYKIFSFFDSAVNAIVTMLSVDDPCEGRLCTNCKPGTGNAEGTCRPTDN